MRRIKTTPAVLTLLAMGLSGFGIWKAGQPDGSEPAGRVNVPNTPAAAHPAPRGDSLSAAYFSLHDKPPADETRRSLGEVRASLLASPKSEAVAQIRNFLDKGEDRVTGLSFEIAKNGSLAEWPTFRTFLLDALLAIDPAAAAAMSRDLLAKPTTADEWALALRNVARGEASLDAAFLRAKTEELIANPAWQADPSIGYLNAFDVLVHVQATDSTPLLSELIRNKGRKDLAHAGFLTLDRLVQSQPVDVLTRLAADPSLHQSRPEMVAQQFARADLRIPAQQALVRAWLLDPARTVTELRLFSGVYPNNNQFVSNNLLTMQAATSGEDLAAHDREALKVIAGWTADPAFTPINEHLRAMVSRLDGFVGIRDSPLSPPPPK